MSYDYTMRPLAQGQLSSSANTILYVATDYTTIRQISLVNTNASSRTVNIYYKLSGGTARRIMPKDHTMKASAKVMVLDAGEVISLGPGDQLQGDASGATSVDYVVQGIVRSEV